MFLCFSSVTLHAQNFWTKVHYKNYYTIRDFTQTDNGNLYCLLSTAVLKSTDGIDWTQPVTSSRPSSGENYLNSYGNTLYLGNCCSSTNRYSGKGFFVSTDDGITWTKKTKGMGADTNIVDVYVFPNGNIETVNLSYDGWHDQYTTYLSTDNGENWSRGRYLAQNWQTANLVVTPKGIFHLNYKTIDNGVNWTYVSEQVIPRAYSAMSDSLYGTIYNSSGQTLFRSKDGETWEPYLYTGFPAERTVENLTITANDTMYATSSESFIAENKGVFRSLDKGRTWTRYSSGLSASSFVGHDLFLAKGGVFYLGQMDGIYRSQKIIPQVLTSVKTKTNQIPFAITESNGITHVTFNLTNSASVNFKVYNVTGIEQQQFTKTQYFLSGENEIFIPTSQLSSGMYMIMLDAGDKIGMGKVVVGKK